MSWNHRVMRFPDPLHEEWLEIHEVYYDDNGQHTMYTEEAVSVAGEAIEELRETLSRMEKALNQPILCSFLGTPDFLLFFERVIKTERG